MPSWRRGLIVSLLFVVATIAPMATASVKYSGNPVLHREVQPTASGTTFTFLAPFVVEEDAEAYFKVIPAPRNAAFLNGSSEEGWWTSVTLTQGAAVLVTAGTNGTSIVELGRLAPETHYALELEVRVPPGGLARPGNLHLNYALAMRGGAGTGSGGQLDPSLSINPVIRVSETAEASVEGSPDASSLWPYFASVGVAAIVGMVALGFWRRRGSGV